MFQRGNRKASRLTGEQVLEIRALYQMRGVTQGSLARKFQVSVNTIANIVNGLTWQSLLGAQEVGRPPPNAVPVQPSEDAIEASMARLKAKLAQPAAERPAPSLYSSPVPYDEPGLSHAAQERIEKALGERKASPGEELDDFLNDDNTGD